MPTKRKMEIENGIAISSKITIGKAFVLNEQNRLVTAQKINAKNISGEKKRYQKAVRLAINELIKIEKQTAHLSDISTIFQGYRLILEDSKQDILYKIESGLFKAEYAAQEWIKKYNDKLSNLKTEVSSRRLLDLKDIEKRLLKHLIPQEKHPFSHLEKHSIIVAKEFLPSQILSLPLNKIVGLVMQTSSETSHSIIVARTTGVSIIVGVEKIHKIATGDTLILDGSTGNVIVKPTKKTIEKYENRIKKFRSFKRNLGKIKKLPCVTLDDKKIHLGINIENPSEAKHISIATNIGLYRTEFIYAKNANPTEETHYKAYIDALQYLEGEKLVIRTLDIGGDKNFGVFNMREENPFLGCRSIRFCFRHENIFREQLRAILRASAHGNIYVMFPMISSTEEIKKAKSILCEVKEELLSKNIPFADNIPIGAMIEVPSAAITCDLIVEEVDFICIGTNDLVQYTLAVDRCNPNVASFYKRAHPAVLRLISHVISVGAKNNTKISICGEISKEMVLLFIGMGLREFSLSPHLVLEIKNLIRHISVRKMEKIVQKIFCFSTHEQIMKYLHRQLKQIEKNY